VECPARRAHPSAAWPQSPASDARRIMANTDPPCLVRNRVKIRHSPDTARNACDTNGFYCP